MHGRLLGFHKQLYPDLCPGEGFSKCIPWSFMIEKGLYPLLYVHIMEWRGETGTHGRQLVFFKQPSPALCFGEELSRYNPTCIRDRSGLLSVSRLHHRFSGIVDFEPFAD